VHLVGFYYKNASDFVGSRTSLEGNRTPDHSDHSLATTTIHYPRSHWYCCSSLKKKWISHCFFIHMFIPL